MEVVDVEEVKNLHDGNTQLKKLVAEPSRAEPSLGKDMLQPVIPKNFLDSS